MIVSWGRGLGAAALLVLLVAPLWLNQYYVLQIAMALVWAIAILGMNIITGYTGQLSLAHNAFIGIGAYAYVLLTTRAGVNYLLAVPVSGVICFLLGFLVGIPALRLRGLYLATVTLAASVAFVPLIKRFHEITGGAAGVLVPKPDSPVWMGLAGYQWRYLVVAFFLITLLAVMRLFLGGYVGRAMIAIKDHEIAAQASGVNLFVFKTVAFGLSAFCGGVAGALLCIVTGYVSPDSFNLDLTVKIIAGSIIGGVVSLGGAIFGGIFVEAIPIIAGDINDALAGLIYGVAIMAVLYAMPGGVAGVFSLLRRRAVGKTVRSVV